MCGGFLHVFLVNVFNVCERHGSSGAIAVRQASSSLVCA